MPERAARLLHFDDEVSIRRLFAARAEVEGFEVHSAESEDETVVLAREVRPHAVVLDIVWHRDYDAGLRLCARLRDSVLDPTPAIIIYSERGDETARRESKHGGAVEYVVKPDLDACFAAVRRALMTGAELTA